MTFHLHFRKDRSHPLGYAKVPTYPLPDWNLHSKSETGVTYRPSPIVFLRRLLWTLLALFLFGLLVWDTGIPSRSNTSNIRQSAHGNRVLVNLQVNQPKINDQFMKKQWKDIQEKQKKAEARQEQIEAERKKFSPTERKAWWAFVGFLILLGTAPPLMCLWQRMQISRNQSDELEIFRLGFWPSRNRYPLENFNHIQIIVQEDIHRVRFRSYHEGWKWIVLICQTDHPSLAVNSFSVRNPVEFHVSQQPDPPFNMTRPPRTVRKFAKQLKRITGVDSVGFTMTKDGVPEYGFFKTTVPKETVTYSEPKETRIVYESLDDMPEEVRKQFREMKKEQEATGQPVTRKTTRIRILDSDGNRQEYSSIDEMPPELQDKYRKLLQKRSRQ